MQQSFDKIQNIFSKRFFNMFLKTEVWTKLWVKNWSSNQIVGLVNRYTPSPGFDLVQDNAQPRVAIVCCRFLDDEGVEATKWPSRKPDPNRTDIRL